jgi:hypothetical protein
LCRAGYSNVDGFCIAQCLQDQFAQPNADGSITCLACNIACGQCVGPLASNCTTCASGYAFNTVGECAVAPKQTLTFVNCGINAYAKNGRCVCYDTSLIYDAESRDCYTQAQWNLLFDCSVGEYYDQSASQCALCNSNNDENLCETCVGASYAECLTCQSGYYLDYSSFSCLACAENCARCESAGSCQQCAPGYYVVRTISSTLQSGTAC